MSVGVQIVGMKN